MQDKQQRSYRCARHSWSDANSAWGAGATGNPHNLGQTDLFVWRRRQHNLEWSRSPLFGNKEVEVRSVVLQPGYLQLE